MNSRERVLNSIEHKQPDRIPFDFGGTSVTGISAMAYNKLKRKLGVSSPTKVYDVVQQLAMVDWQVINSLGTDVLDINRIFMEDMGWHTVTLGDGSSGEYPDWFKPERGTDGGFVARDHLGKTIARMPEGGMCFDQTCFPWEQGYPDTFEGIGEAFQSINWIAHSHSKYIQIDGSELRARTQGLRDSSDKAITMSGGAKLLELGFFLRRMDNFLMDLLAERAKVSKLLDKLMDIHLTQLEKKLNALGDLVDVIRFGDDLGMTSGPFMDLEVFRALLKPRYKVLCDFVKQNSSMKIFFHSCGSIRQYIPDLIEAGFDIINPVQTNAHGMDPLELKKEFGREVTFWGGGVDTSSVLPTGTQEEVRIDVLNRCEVFSRDGGFVFAPIHNILPEVPPENIIAMYDAVKEFNGESY
jgi:uroporphyrinogen decarboxylase